MTDPPRPRRPPSRPEDATGREPGNKDKILPPTLLQPGDVEALIEACDQTRHAIRNRALITFLYRTGAVIGEALAVRLSDVDLSDNSVRLTGGQKSAARTLGIDEPLRAALCAWLRHRETLALAGDWLFCNTGTTRRVYLGGQAMSYEAVQHLMTALTANAGLGATRVHAQAFRHSFAAELLGEGWPLPYIQRQLGIIYFRNMDRLINNLDLQLPEEDEVMAIIRTRVWDRS
jgi:site-specific recombinase XerD